MPSYRSKDTDITYGSLTALLAAEGSGGAGLVTGADFNIDSSSFYSCGTSLNGGSYGGPLPLSLLSWTAEIHKGLPLLKWSSIMDETAHSFIVERSLDGNSWDAIDSFMDFETKGEAEEFSMIDDNAPIGIVYYRLDYIEIDGSIDFSTIKSLVIKSNQNLTGKPWPNPVKDYLTIQVESDSEAIVNVSSISGKKLNCEKFQQDGKLQINMSSLPSGIYFVCLTELSGTSSFLITKE